MTKQDNTAGLKQAGSNITKLKQDVKKGVEKIEALKLDRSAINEKIGAVRSDLEAKGIPKKCLDMAMQYLNMDPDKREGFDIAYEIVREAIDLPLQTAQMNMDELYQEPAKTLSDKKEGEE